MRRVVGTMVSVLLLAGFLAGCAAPTPQVIEKEKVVEKPVVQTVVVEKEKVVEKPVVQTVVVEKEVPVAAEVSAVQKWKLVNPEGVVVVEPMTLAARINTLEGKTILLRWNGKHNGNNFLDRVAELLAEQVPTAKVIKLWEEHPETAVISGSPEKSKQIAATVAEYKPDIVIGSQCD